MRAGGVIYLELRDKFQKPAADTAWVVSLAVTVRMLFGPLASALCNRFSCRTVVMVGGILCAIGTFFSGFADQIWPLYITYALVGGIGRAFIYTPAVVIVGLYFEKRRGTAAGIANAGIGSGTFLIPPLVELMFANFAFTSAFIFLAGFALQATFFGSLMRPLEVNYRMISRGRKRQSSSTEIVGTCKEENDINKNKQTTQNTIEKHEVHLPVLLSRKDLFSSLSTMSAHSAYSDTGSRNISFRGSAYSLQAIQTSDTGAFIVTKLNEIGYPKKPCIAAPIKILQKIEKEESEKENNLLIMDTEEESEANQKLDNLNKKWLDVTLLKDIRFLTFCIGIGLYTFSFQASYVFIPALAIQKNMSHLQAAYIVSIAGGLETLGSIISGIFLDLPSIRPHRLNLYNFTMFLLGALTFLMPIVQHFVSLSFVCGVYGFLLGSCLAQKATLVVDILGVENIVSSIGLLVCFQGFGVLIGPPLSGFLRDTTGLYDEGFYLGGATMVASGAVQCFGSFWYWLKQRNKKSEIN
ncbi:hypothetical protein FSP39_003061 [Pinctada imbricata]|uniref:Major facilitator superfamily (MFS) profile domain-containing protein n=1 Tax=Pinctada imbricata TaxID=66713 RepID=A0AA88XTG6_PINIB|nr:hypothetical protein FSP39_003061 [Pinctada imbricata]